MGKGTKEQFAAWLASQGLTLTRYNKMAPESKKAIYLKYQKRGKQE